jgi:hypothetical protein
LQYELQILLSTIDNKIHSMREKIALLLFPTAGRMDHVIPAIRYVRDQSMKRGTVKLIVEFLPLNNIASQNLPKFIKSIKSQWNDEIEKDGLSSNESGRFSFQNGTECDLLEDWGKLLEERIQDYKSISVFAGCTVALGSEIPEDIALQTTVTSLSHNDITMIKIPTGYDIQTPPDLFNPDARLSEQIKLHELLGSLSIRTPLIFVAKNPVVREVLMTIRKLYDREKSKSTDGFKSQVIKSEINSHRKQNGGKVDMKSTNLSNKLKDLRSNKLITSENAKHNLTKMGMVLSGILSD